MKKLFPILLIASFGACKNPTCKTVKVNTIKPFTYITPTGDKIVFLDNYYQDYLNAIKTNYKSRDGLCQVIIDGPIYREYFSKGEYIFANDEYSFVIKDSTGFESTIAKLEASKEKIEKLITSALLECRKYLKNDNITFCISPADAD
ncbi:MAG TPA: hypothetical protein VK890_04860, partial [Bacteroidia bacterium]|nr:hypothetical protein [Bacteroidia bacterium]